MKQSVRRLTFAVATLAMLVPAVASAQQQPKAQEQPQTEAPETLQNIPDQKLDAAAAAMQQVASLKQTFQQRYDSAQPAEKEQIANEASAALTKVVTDKGLSIEEYSAILATAQNDPAVRDKILDRIRKPQQ
jgi:hypothetical protein